MKKKFEETTVKRIMDLSNPKDVAIIMHESFRDIQGRSTTKPLHETDKKYQATLVHVAKEIINLYKPFARKI